MDILLLREIVTVLTFVSFIGIVIWALSARNKKCFDEASRIPLDDDPHPNPLPREREQSWDASSRESSVPR